MIKYVLLMIAVITIGIVAAEKFEHLVDKKALEKIEEYKAKGKPAYCSFWK